MLKSNDDSDDSFTSINTDIQKTIINEQHKAMAAYGRQGTHGHRKDNLLTINVIGDNSEHTQTQQNLSGFNPFVRSLTSRTQFKINSEEHYNSSHNVDEESLYTEDDQIESQSRDNESEVNRDSMISRSRTLRENQGTSGQPFLSPIKIPNKSSKFVTNSSQDSTHMNISNQQVNQMNVSPKSWGGIVSSPLVGSSPWRVSPQKQFLQPSYLPQQSFQFPQQQNACFLQAPPTMTYQQQFIPPQQLLQAPVFIPTQSMQFRPPPINPYYLNPNTNVFERQKSIVSNSTNSSHTSTKSKQSINKSLILINQAYKSLEGEKEKLDFLLQNASLMAKDQNGCRRIQKKLDDQAEKGNLKFCEDMLNTLLDSMGDLMLDSFANYLCQKLLKFAKDYQIDLILKKIQDQFVRIAIDKHGTRVLQQLLAQIAPLNKERSQIISESIKDKVLELSINLHGNHVVQLCLDHFSSEECRQPIYQTVVKYCSQIATDKHGCCVIQKLLSSPSFTIQDELVNKSISQIQLLINNQFGNYVIQQILKFNNNDLNLQITNFICTNFLFFCTQKISSNVVENAIKLTSQECQKIIFTHLMKNSQIFIQIMLDQFGNYIIQAIFQKSSDFQDQTYFNFFFKIFEENQESLKKVNFGSKFIQKVKSYQPMQTQSNQASLQRQKLMRQNFKGGKSDTQGNTTGKQYKSNSSNDHQSQQVRFTKKKSKQQSQYPTY